MSVPSVVIREIYAPSEISFEDLEAINRLLDQLSPRTVHQFSHDDLVDLLIKGTRFLIASSIETHDAAVGGCIVGVTFLARVAKATRWHGEIHDVIVDTTLHGRGIGRALTLRAIELAQEDQRLGFVELTSRPSRVAANNLYQSLGFELIAISNPVIGDHGTNLYRLKLR